MAPHINGASPSGRARTSRAGFQTSEPLGTNRETFQALHSFALEYEFLDTVFDAMGRTGQTPEGVLTARGTCRGGQRVLSTTGPRGSGTSSAAPPDHDHE